jgi:hypothetical protein
VSYADVQRLIGQAETQWGEARKAVSAARAVLGTLEGAVRCLEGAGADEAALDQIAGLLEQDWSPGMRDKIAGVVRGTGRDIGP